MEVFVGTVSAFGFPFAPQGWAGCNGQLLSISQNEALYTLLGTTYGGDGVTTFGVPDLRGRKMLNQGTGPGLQNKVIGQKAGLESTTLTINNLPSHTHAVLATTAASTLKTPSGPNVDLLAAANGTDSGGNSVTVNIYAPPGTATATAPCTSISGSNQPVSIMAPYLVVNFCISLFGIFPSQN